MALNCGIAQTLTFLDHNNAAAALTDQGVFFQNTTSNHAGYEIPKGSGRNAIYSFGIWFAAEDINGQVKLAANQYSGGDLFNGPLTVNAGQPPAPGTWTPTMVTVTKAEIDDHIANYANAGYVAPQGILDWPAHGDVALGFDFNLAPFVDVDFDGVYDPSQGDFPCIKGHEATYLIMNDMGDVHASGGDPLGIEIHFMFYQYATSDDLNNTTFCNVRVINRGTQSYPEFKVALFADADLGSPFDDYIGSDEQRNLMYTYNGDGLDEDFGAASGYGAIPPAIGIMSLNHDLTTARAATSGSPYPYGMPSTPAEYWNFMSGNLLDGSPVSDAFEFSDDPMTNGDNEVTLSNQPGDRRMVGTIYLGSFTPGDEVEMDIAVVFNQGAVDNLESASGLLTVADLMQNFYDNDSEECLNETLNVTDLTMEAISVSPNPSSGTFELTVSEGLIGANYEITDLTGRRVLPSRIIHETTQQVELSQPAGVYLLTIQNGNHALTKRIAVE